MFAVGAERFSCPYFGRKCSNFSTYGVPRDRHGPAVLAAGAGIPFSYKFIYILSGNSVVLGLRW